METKPKASEGWTCVKHRRAGPQLGGAASRRWGLGGRCCSRTRSTKHEARRQGPRAVPRAGRHGSRCGLEAAGTCFETSRRLVDPRALAGHGVPAGEPVSKLARETGRWVEARQPRNIPSRTEHHHSPLVTAIAMQFSGCPRDTPMERFTFGAYALGMSTGSTVASRDPEKLAQEVGKVF